MSETDAPREQIRLTSELIFDVLYHQDGEMDIEQLREKVTHSMPFFDWAIGWLAEEDDIEIIPKDASFAIRRKAPSPAVFPLRSN